MARDFQKMYREKLLTAEEAAAMVKSGNWIDYGFFNGKPVAFDRALAARKDELKDVFLVSAVTVPPVPEVMTQDPKGETFTYMDFHFSPVTRFAQQKRPNVFYNPIQFGEAESYYEIKGDDPRKIGTEFRDFSVVRTTPMDDQGFFNFGLSNAITWVQLTTARHPIVEVCQQMPYCYGGNRERIHISQVEYVIEGDDTPPAAMPPSQPTEIDKKIATHVLEHIKDGTCLQLGIGGMPNALGTMINDTDLKDLSGHTEMLVDSYLDMYESGKLTNMKKYINRGKTVYTFALGSSRLYEFMDHNAALASFNVDYVNHPLTLAQIDNLVSINSALEVDLYTQISAESSGFGQISGNGGMLDFVLGAFWSKGGRSIICLPSTRKDKNGNLVSRIVPNFTMGTMTTIPRQAVNIIATEYGWVSLKGDSSWVRAEKIISIAHPDFRDELIRAAEERKIWRRSNRLD